MLEIIFLFLKTTKQSHLHCSDFSTPVGKWICPILSVFLNHVNYKQLGLGEKGELNDLQSDHYPLDSSEEASPENGEYSMFAEKKFSTHQHHCHLAC